jgi:carbamoyltransferase
MMILGISDGKEGSACLLKDGKIIHAVDEERLTRVKMQPGFPKRSVERILSYYGTGIDVIAVGGIVTPFILTRVFRRLQKIESGVLAGEKNLNSHASNFIKYGLRWSLADKDSPWIKFQKPVLPWILKRELPDELKEKPIMIVDHHVAHASSAFFTSSLGEALCITADGYGDGVSLSVSACRGRNITRLYEIRAWDSFGLFYGLITVMLGFKAHMHEGKVTGLAAFGNAENVSAEFPFVEKEGRIRYTGNWGESGLREFGGRLKENSREDVAAWLQKNLETEICALAKSWINRTGLRNIVLAGGVFANVKLNQRICELPEAKSVYVFPDMGDGGISAGAALNAWSKEENVNHDRIMKNMAMDDVYLGWEYSDDKIEASLKRHGLEYSRARNIEPVVARLLSEGLTVARFNGRMEFGPRALGNRSILCQATDSSVNDWLNKKLSRTEFMPFAPSTLVEYAGSCYLNFEKAPKAAGFMTITFPCTPWMTEKCPGAVHRDGTARPQLVSKKSNPSFYKIIDGYMKLTGIPTIINTSFNMHGEPIVESPDDAIRTFLSARLDCLAMGNFIVKRE